MISLAILVSCTTLVPDNTTMSSQGLYNKTYWSSSVGSVSSNLEIIVIGAPGRSESSVRSELDLPGDSVHWLLLQEEHGVGGGSGGQAEDGESDLHVLVVRVGLSAL